ncbi:MAG TPA: hypothetical protein VHL11_05285 [Phototrophicaceae bacterium]|nr:hypothetical protein [Phototrophicaceae bacterium]
MALPEARFLAVRFLEARRPYRSSGNCDVNSSDGLAFSTWLTINPTINHSPGTSLLTLLFEPIILMVISGFCIKRLQPDVQRTGINRHRSNTI